MLFLLDRGVKAIKWNGIPLHEAESAIVKEEQNGDFTLNVRYPITDSGIYQLIQEDMLIKAPAPVLGPQLFRIKKPIENDDHLEIQAYHITDDVMKRSVKPLKVVNLGCAMALSQMVQNAKADIQDFSFTSDIWDKRTFNTTEDDTLYSILLDGKHSIVGTWEGELVRDNFALTVKKNRGTNRGVIITTHKNLKSYQRTKDSQNVVTRIYAKSTFKAEGAEQETTLKVTVDSPLINSYPYVNEKEYENNNAKTVDELRQWAEAKFKNEGIDKSSDAIKIEAYELDGQIVHIGDTVNLKSRKHNIDIFKKAIAYEFNALTEEYISLTFDDKPGVGGSRVSNGISSVANEILEIGNSAQEIAIERALRNADKAFDAEFEKQKSLINDGIEQAKAKAEQVKSEINQSIEQKLQQTKSEVVEKVKQDLNQGLASANAEINKVKQNLTNLQSNSEATTKQLKSDLVGIRTKQSEAEAEINKQVQALTKTKEELVGVKSAQATYEQTTTRRLAELTNLTNGKAERSYVEQTSRELLSKIASVSVGGRNLFLNSLFKQDIKKTGIWTTSTYAASTDSANKYLGHSALKIVGQDPVEKDGNNPKITYPALGMFGEVVAGSATDRDVVISFYAKSAKNGTILLSRLGNVGYVDNQNVSLTTEIKHYVVKIPRSATKNAKHATNEWLFRLNQADTVWIWMPKFEFGTIDTAYSEAPEDMGSQISAVESSFKQRADSLEAGVTRLTEGLKTKADTSAVNVLADSIKQSVKSLETDTQNKLNQKLSTAEFEVRATGIRQEIVNATKNKADKSLVTAEAGKIREEISRISVGGKNLLKGSKGEFKPDINPSNFDNNVLYMQSTSIDLVKGEKYLISAKTDGVFSNNHNGTQESDNVVLWLMDKTVTNYQIVSDSNTGTTGTLFTWNKPNGTYHLRVNTYHKDTRKKVWEVKVERGTIKTDWSPAPEDTDEQITAARAIFEKTAEGLKTDMTAVKSYVADDGKRREQLEQYTRTETARSTEALRKQVSESYVAKSQHTEDVRGITRRFEELAIGGNNLLAYANLNEGGYYQNALKQDPAYIYSNLIEIKNKNYCLQVWETNDDAKKIWVGMQYFDEAKKPLVNGYSSLYFSSYRKYVLEVPATAKYIAISLDKRALNKDEIKFKLEVGTVPTDWSPAPEDSKNYTNTKLAEYKQTVDGELKKLQSSVGEMVKKTDINITPGQISFGTGKVVNGKTIASLFVQNPESIEAITKLMRITGDLIVDGSITGRDLAANTITTAHLAAGAVTTKVLAADAVTADELKVDYALVRKLTADDALLNNLVAKQAFINKLSTIDFSATQIKGGILKSLNNHSTFDLQRSILTFKRNDDFTTVLDEDGLYLKKQNKKILGLTYKEYSAHSNFTNNAMAEFEFNNDTSLAFSTSEFASVFMEIYPKKETIYIRSGFKLYFGEGQSVALEHVYGTLDGVDYSAFRVLGTDRDQLMFFRDGRIELYHKKY